MTMMGDLHMNSYLIREAKLGGDLNLNDNAVYNNDTPLFEYRN